MKAMAIISRWIVCSDEGGHRCVIPQGTRIMIETWAHGYRVSWREPMGRRRAARWTDGELDTYRRRALRSYRVMRGDPATDAVLRAFRKASDTDCASAECYRAGVEAWLRIHPDHTHAYAAKEAVAVILAARSPELFKIE